MRRRRRLLGVVVAVVLVGACGGDDGDDSRGGGPAPETVQMRPVIDADVSPCTPPAVVLGTECLTLGPVEVDAGVIEAMSATATELRVRFSAAGLIKYNKAAADSGLRRVAVLVDGTPVAAPAVAGIPLEPDVVLAGSFSPQLIARLGQAFPADS
jgi:hypothetical protein